MVAAWFCCALSSASGRSRSSVSRSRHRSLQPPLARLGRGLLSRRSYGCLRGLDGFRRRFGERERVALLTQAVERGLPARLRRAGNGLVGKLLGKLRCRRAVGAPQRQPGQHDEHHPAGECAGRLALMPGQGAEDRQPGLEQVERHAGKRIGPAVDLGRPPGPAELKRECCRCSDAAKPPPPSGAKAHMRLDQQSSAALWGTLRGSKKPTVFEGQPDKLTEIISSASTLGVAMIIIDTPSKNDAVTLAAVRAADLIVCPVMVDLFSLAGLQDTARVIDLAGKLKASVAVLNDLDESGVVANIGEAEAVLKAIGMPACAGPDVPSARLHGRHRQGSVGDGARRQAESGRR